MPTVISYLRVSTSEQAVENQRRAIADADWKIDKEFADEAVSGTTDAATRKAWSKCLEYVREGDTLVVYAVDRIGRSTVDVLTEINRLAERGVRMVILQQGFDTHTPAGKLALTMFAAFAEFEHGIRQSRQLEGIRRAQAEGKYRGRKPKLTSAQRIELKSRFHAGENRSALAREFKIDRVTVHRYANS